MAMIMVTPGETHSASLTFSHKGGGGYFDTGIGLARAGAAGHNNVFIWFFKNIYIPSHTVFTPVAALISFPWPAGQQPGNFDVLKFIQTTNGPQDPGGNGFLRADWDDDVYSLATAVDEFSALVATYT